MCSEMVCVSECCLLLSTASQTHSTHCVLKVSVCVCVCPAVIPFMEVYNKSLCRPRELLVEILQEYPEEVEHIYIPSCVVLTRCAGCCNDEMLQCTPTSTHNITMEVRP